MCEQLGLTGASSTHVQEVGEMGLETGGNKGLH